MLDALPAEYSARSRDWCAVWVQSTAWSLKGTGTEEVHGRFISVERHVWAIRSRIRLLYSSGKGHVPGMSGSSAAWIQSIQHDAWMGGFLARRSAGRIKISSREIMCMNLTPWWLIPCTLSDGNFFLEISMGEHASRLFAIFSPFFNSCRVDAQYDIFFCHITAQLYSAWWGRHDLCDSSLLLHICFVWSVKSLTFSHSIKWKITKIKHIYDIWM